MGATRWTPPPASQRCAPLHYTEGFALAFDRARAPLIAQIRDASPAELDRIRRAVAFVTGQAWGMDENTLRAECGAQLIEGTC